MNFGQQLRVHRQPAVELIAGLGDQTLGKLSLEHQDGAPSQTEKWTFHPGGNHQPQATIQIRDKHCNIQV